MPELNTYLSFDGNCAEAMRFYERVLDGKLESIITNGQSPVADQVPAGNADRVMHARLSIPGGVIMAGDALAGQPFQPMKGFHLTLTYPTAEEARRLFEALADGGRVTMPFDKSFWADGFGMLVDRFGTPWIVNGGMIPMG
jgi:PhnB protein